MTSTRRILFVANRSTYFAIGRMPFALAARAAGYDVQVATPDDGMVPAIVDKQLPWHRIGMSRGVGNPIGEARTILSLARLYRSLRPDLVHHIPLKTVLYGTIAARMARVPAVVNTIAGLGHIFLSDRPADRAIRLAAGIAFRFGLRHRNAHFVFHNAGDLDVFASNGWVRSGEASVIQGSGVDTRRFAPVERPDRVPVVLFPSRLVYTKGLREFIAAARELRSETIEARLVLVGPLDPGNRAAATEEDVSEWTRAGIVEWWGDSKDMAATYAQADIVCLPSYREGLSKSLIEASSCGLPIITTDAPGCRDVVRDGETGLLVPVRDSVHLADAIRKLVASPDLRRELGRRGRERALAEFASERILAANLEVYRSLLARV